MATGHQPCLPLEVFHLDVKDKKVAYLISWNVGGGSVLLSITS